MMHVSTLAAVVFRHCHRIIEKHERSVEIAQTIDYLASPEYVLFLDTAHQWRETQMRGDYENATYHQATCVSHCKVRLYQGA